MMQIEIPRGSTDDRVDVSFMSDLLWVLQNNMRDQALLLRLQECIALANTNFCSVIVEPFSDAVPVLSCASSMRVICYGASFVPRVATLTSWQPGIFFHEPNFR
jgi:hypothetical protein